MPKIPKYPKRPAEKSIKYPKKSKCPKEKVTPRNSQLQGNPSRTAPQHDFTSALHCLRKSHGTCCTQYPHRSASRSADKRGKFVRHVAVTI